FKNFISLNGLIDIGFHGPCYTWTNYQVGVDNIKERLDRVLCNHPWRIEYDKAKLYHETMIRSDHNPLRLELIDYGRNEPAPFRFDTRWFEYTRCDEIVTQRWRQNEPSHQNLINLQENLRWWSKSEVYKEDKEIQKLKRQIVILSSRPHDESVAREEKQLR
ncbi:hypothetical protein LINGRAHAP2_LOCUS25121, partial [Linum grandiflorum]